ncbi:hypothetical protein ABT236_14840 [Streptomyces sp. NPDC001523]|uniref:hypothetical protein n=1 Tax=Streptomyces sp. NPDC001523 TaxID=3154383 RepID=UPI00332C6EDF
MARRRGARLQGRGRSTRSAAGTGTSLDATGRPRGGRANTRLGSGWLLGENHTEYESGAGQNERCSGHQEDEHTETTTGVPGPRRAADSCSGQPYHDHDAGSHRSPEEDPDREEEASVALRLAHEIIDRAPGVIAASFDTAWRGVHRTGLVRRGIIVFTRQHDGIKPHPLERFRYQDCTHDIYATAGRACERQITVNGKTMYSPLPVRELEVRAGNTWRFYHRVEIPCRHGAHTERIPVYETQEDQRIDPRTKRKKFNRTEHLRQVPPNTDYGDRLLGFRQDSESGNCTLDYSHRDNRVPAYGAQAALLVYLGFAWMINSISLATAASPST